MVPEVYAGYFTAAAAAAGALIGLLFVAVSLRPESVFGDGASAGRRALAGSTFTGLVNGFFVSLLALIPRANLGYGAGIMAVISLSYTIALHRRIPGSQAHLVMLTLSVLAFLAQLVSGILLIAAPHDSDRVSSISYVLIASFGVALGRAWALLEGREGRRRKGPAAEPGNPGTQPGTREPGTASGPAAAGG